MRAIGILALALAAAAPAPAAAQQLAALQPPPRPAGECANGVCRIQMSPQRLLLEAERLVRLRQFDRARPLLEALALAPSVRMEARFLTGLMAAETGDFDTANGLFKAILTDDPAQTRVRLELGRVMLRQGKAQSADRQFKLAEQSGDLPPEIARTIRNARDILRQQRAWRFDVNFGIAPDTNINNATSADTITGRFGDFEIPLQLGEDARPRSGLGQTGGVSAGLRLPVARSTSMLVDFDSLGTNYAGRDFDDYLVQLAVGPELRVAQIASVSLQAVGAQRWFGGNVLNRQAGVRLGAQTAAGPQARAGMQLDLRHTDARFNGDFTGWQGSLNATYERGLARTLVASVGLFARRDWLAEAAWSSTELGGSLGLGGELPMGINFGVSGSVGRAVYDAPLAFFSADARRDWRFVGRATLGNRKLRFMGFSPQVSYTFTRNATPVTFFDSQRSRFTFAVARYF